MFLRHAVDLEQTTIDEFDLKGGLAFRLSRRAQLQIHLEQAIRATPRGHFHAQFNLRLGCRAQAVWSARVFKREIAGELRQNTDLGLGRRDLAALIDVCHDKSSHQAGVCTPARVKEGSALSWAATGCNGWRFLRASVQTDLTRRQDKPILLPSPTDRPQGALAKWRVTTLQILGLVFFAALAGVVLFNLYAVLGKRVGRQPEDALASAVSRRAIEATPPATDGAEGVALSGLAAVRAQDPGFEIDSFLAGARTAYETIVKAFAANDRQTLKSLTDPHVFSTFETAIAEREKAGLLEKVEFINPARADLESAEVSEDRAIMRVRFLSEFRSTSKAAQIDGAPEPAPDERRAAEVWTFERPSASRDPNWILSRVEAAQA